MEKVIVIVGPTGVGKTRMSVELAKKLNGEVISGDSMQVYRGMDIGTAKVTTHEMQGVTHHLIDILDFDEQYSVAMFQENVRQLIREITLRGKVPIIAGGTGLYIKAALYDYTFEKTEIDTQYYVKKYESYDDHQLYQRLIDVDHESAKSIHPHNRQRVLRAIAIFESTGIKKSDNLAKQQGECLYDAYFVGLTLDREILYQRINQRVDAMMSQGLEDEMRKLIGDGAQPTMQSMKAIGYKEWFDYFDGNKDLQEVSDLIKKNSRNYAKRQYTWFNNQVDVHWYQVNLTHFEETIEVVYKDIKSND